jgi:hypothetical protein
MVMSPHALTSSATPLGLENVKLLRRNSAANALFAHLGKADLDRAGDGHGPIFPLNSS